MTSILNNNSNNNNNNNTGVAVVRFNENVMVIKSLHINDYTDDEILSTWFTKKEYKQMKREVKLTVAMMEKQAKFEEGINFSSRGLEYKLESQLIQKAQHYFYAMDAILEEQERQRNELGLQCADPISLSYVYAEYSFISHMEAFLIAATDERFALGYMTTTSVDQQRQQQQEQQSKEVQEETTQSIESTTSTPNNKKSSCNNSSSTCCQSPSSFQKLVVPQVMMIHAQRI